MKTKRLFPAAIWGLLALGTVQAQVIVANSSVKIAEISKSDLNEIFTGASSNFINGSRAIPATLKSGPVHEAFLKGYIGRTELLFRGNWRGLVFAGKGTMPHAFDTEAELIHYIASVPGSIGYVGTPPHDAQVKTLVVK